MTVFSVGLLIAVSVAEEGRAKKLKERKQRVYINTKNTTPFPGLEMIESSRSVL